MGCQGGLHGHGLTATAINRGITDHGAGRVFDARPQSREVLVVCRALVQRGLGGSE